MKTLNKPRKEYVRRIAPSPKCRVVSGIELPRYAQGVPFSFLSLNGDMQARKVLEALQRLYPAGTYLNFPDVGSVREGVVSGAVVPLACVPVLSCPMLQQGAYTLAGTHRGMSALIRKDSRLWVTNEDFVGLWHQIILLRENARGIEGIARQLWVKLGKSEIFQGKWKSVP